MWFKIQAYLSLSPEQQRPELLVSAVKIRQRQVGGKCTDTWYKQIEPTKTAEL